jgi:hypothetical protein
MSDLPTITIEDLDPTAVPNRAHRVPAMREGLTVHLLVQQILGLLVRADLDGKLFAEDMAFDPAGSIVAEDVQAAIEELDAEKQALNGNLTALAGLTGAADRLAYFTAAQTLALATMTAFGRSLIDDADAAAGRATLGAAPANPPAGSEGAYMLIRTNGNVTSQGGTFAGSNINPAALDDSGNVGTNASAASGTWEVMGADMNATFRVGLALRRTL